MLTLWILAMALSGSPPMDSSDTPDLILTGGTIHTLDPARPKAEAVAIRGGRIIYVGDSAGLTSIKGPATRTINLSGLTIVPGLTDAHGHLAGLGFSLARLDLVGTESAAQVAGLVKRKAATLAPGDWITGRGWDQNDWRVTSFPTRKELDAAAPDHPVALERIDGHATWVNSRALLLAGITKHTPAPSGGQIIRDEGGEPTGIFVDNAEDLILSKIPGPSRDQTREALTRSMRKCLEAGLTQVHDAGVSEVGLDLYREILVAGDFPFRVYAMLSDDDALLADHFAKGPEIGLGDHRLTVRTVKVYMDGALGSRGAALLAPYQDDSANTGLLRTQPERLTRIARQAVQRGFQIAVHAIGDRGNRLALDALQAALRDGAGHDLRFRIEHVQTLAPEEFPRFASLGIIASMQPTHATSDMYWAEERLGAERVKGAYAWRTLLDSGARLVCGSDFPVESEKPLLGFYAAVTRQDAKGLPEGGWFPRQRLTRDEALACFTSWPAYAAFEEELRGMIAPGRLADMTVLTKDIMTVPPAEILETAVAMTIVGGRIAYEKP